MVSQRAAAAAARKMGNLNAWWGGEPMPAKRAAAMKAGLLGEETEIVLGGADRDVQLRSGEHILSPRSWEARYESWISPLEVSVYFDTSAFPAVNCSGGTFPLARARTQGITISCKLAGEK